IGTVRLLLEEPPRDFQLAPNGQSAPSRFSDKVCGLRNTWREDEPLSVLEKFGVRPVEEEPRPQMSPLRRIAESRFRFGVADGHLNSALEQRASQRAAAPGKTQDSDTSRKQRAFHRNFSVERPMTAKRMATIQNRMMTRDSSQPASSKWWCSGAMRK